MELVLLVIFVALIFEYINGFHDTANSIATVVSTKVLTPRQAVMMAAVTNLGGAMLGTAVAKTISSGLIDSKVVAITSEMLVCALLGAIIWDLVTWWFGMPSSSSHALVGGLCGAAVAGAHNQWAAIVWSKPDPITWYKGGGLLWKVIAPMFTSPLAGFILGFLIMGLLYAVITLLKISPRLVNLTFGKAQILSAGAMGVMHGTNDAQKTMGIIALALMAGTTAGTFDKLPGWLRWLYYPEQGPSIYEAYNRLGELHRDGRGLPQNDTAAAEAFEHAYKNKNLNAQFNLGLLYLEGKGVPVNYKEAAALIQGAAEKNHPAAQLKLAQMYRAGLGVLKNEDQAAEWQTRAATNKNAGAKPAFASRKLKDQPTNAVAAVAWLRDKAEHGSADAQVTLGVAYATGKGTAENLAEALRCFQTAAARHHADALYNLGLLHLQGQGTPHNNEEAAKCFLAATKTEGIKLWIKLACALTMAAGTAAGGWRIIRTLGHKMVKLQSVNGFAAETSSAAVIFLATTLGIPVSTTHNISAAIMGVGSARRFNAIKWTVVERMVWAWVLTIPVTGGLAYLLVRLAQVVGWIK